MFYSFGMKEDGKCKILGSNKFHFFLTTKFNQNVQILKKKDYLTLLKIGFLLQSDNITFETLKNYLPLFCNEDRSDDCQLPTFCISLWSCISSFLYWRFIKANNYSFQSGLPSKRFRSILLSF